MQIIRGAKEKLGWGCQLSTFEPQSISDIDSHEYARISVNCASYNRLKDRGIVHGIFSYSYGFLISHQTICCSSILTYLRGCS